MIRGIGEEFTTNPVTGSGCLTVPRPDWLRPAAYDSDRGNRPFGQTSANPEVLAERIVYGERQASDQQLNLRTKVYGQFDGAGSITISRYDFKGNLLRSRRQLVQHYRDQVDWLQSPALEAGIGFPTSKTYDALNRPVNIACANWPSFSRER